MEFRARGIKPNALIAAMYARKRFSNRESYGILRNTDSALAACFRYARLRFRDSRSGMRAAGSLLFDKYAGGRGRVPLS
jgi:hypothetical protein